MNAATTDSTNTSYVSFFVDELLLGVPIGRVQEINSQLEMTPVPNLPDFVRGVLNLRGDVVTVIDVKVVLHGKRTEVGPQTKNVMVRIGTELVGLLVDRIGDVLRQIDDLGVERNEPGLEFGDAREDRCDDRGVHDTHEHRAALIDRQDHPPGPRLVRDLEHRPFDDEAAALRVVVFQVPLEGAQRREVPVPSPRPGLARAASDGERPLGLQSQAS